MSGGIPLWPAQASAHARQVDLLIGSFGAMVWLLTLPVFILCAVYAFRYRRGRAADRRVKESGNVGLELSWSLIPFFLTLFFYVWATRLYFGLEQPPANAEQVDVVAKQWMWKFQHMAGAREINALHVPVGTPVKLVMTSEDVIHSLYVPALRIKQDLVPGRYTQLWFTADRPGRYPLRCAEFCGADHSVMGATLIVQSRGDYATWLAAARDGGTTATLAEQGRRLFAASGCTGCHGAKAAGRAPSLRDIAGRPVMLADGSTVTADDDYLRDAIVAPNKQVVAGYPAIMPTYQRTLTPEQVNAVVAFLKAGGQP
jgi:cytochrome c oxidase subunit 2